jgi:hypothetical protein
MDEEERRCAAPDSSAGSSRRQLRLRWLRWMRWMRWLCAYANPDEWVANDRDSITGM